MMSSKPLMDTMIYASASSLKMVQLAAYNSRGKPYAFWR